LYEICNLYIQLLFINAGVAEMRKRMERLDILFESVIQYVRTALDSEVATLYVVDRENNQLFTQTHSNHDTPDRVNIVLDEGLVGRCATTGRVVNTSDRGVLRRHDSSFDTVSKVHVNSVLCTPIFGRNKEVIGVLQVVNKKSSKDFTTRDEHILASMATHLSVALQNLNAATENVKLEQYAETKIEILDALKSSYEHYNLQKFES